jgi:hypothetical protein
MAKQFWVRNTSEVRGPFSVDDLQRLAREGKLKPGHELSPDRQRWKPAGSVGGLTFAEAVPTSRGGEAGAVGMAAHRAVGRERRPALIAGGAGLLLGTLLLVGVAAVGSQGVIGGGVATVLFTLALGVGYAAVVISREMTAIYALLMVAGVTILFGYRDPATGSAFPIWAASLGGLALAAAVVMGCRLLAAGSGHDYTAPGIHQQDLVGFDAEPVRGRDAQRLFAAVRDPALVSAPARVRLRLDPDDLARTEPTLAESLEGEVKRGSPALAISLAIHAAVLLGLWLVRWHAVTEEEQLRISGGWISERELTEVADKPNSPIPVELQSLDLTRERPRDSAAPANPTNGPPLQPLGEEPGTSTAAKPVDVGGLFDGRTGESRHRALAGVDGGEQVETAVAAGLRWLLRQQQDAGNWQLHDGYPDPSEPVLKTDTGATALALLALLGNGQTHVSADDEPTRAAVEKGINWLVGVQKPSGDFHDWDELGRQTAYYAHSQAVIAICEAYAMTGDRRLIEPAQRGIDFLLKSQQPVQGGWKYQPQDENSVGDLSVTGWALMALHTARAAGLHVPREPFERGMGFLDLVQSEDGARYRYEPRPGWAPTPAMTAEGLLCRQYLGWRDDHPALQSGVDYLLGPANEPTWQAGKRNVYAWYYTGQVLHNLGDERFQPWYGRAAAEIVAHQIMQGRSDVRGSWHPARPIGAPYEYAAKAGRLYFTAMCLLVLETPYRHRAVTP